MAVLYCVVRSVNTHKTRHGDFSVVFVWFLNVFYLLSFTHFSVQFCQSSNCPQMQMCQEKNTTYTTIYLQSKPSLAKIRNFEKLDIYMLQF